MNSISYTIISCIFSIILLIVYFSKERINYVENKIYSIIVITTFISCFTEIISFILVKTGFSANSPAYQYTIKFLFLGFLMWLYLFSLYTVAVGRKLRGVLKDNTLPAKKLTVGFALIVLIVLALPLQIIETNGLLLPVGTSVMLIYILATMCIIVMIISMILGRKNLKSRKYVPLYLLIFFFAVVLVVQKLLPELFLINPAFVVIAFSMYFTIENPDMNMVDELIENKKLIERAAEEKSIFLFKMSQGLKEPVNAIDKQIKIFENNNLTKKDIAIVMGNINQNNQKMNYLINDVIGLSSTTNNNIKKVENTYNIYSLLEDVKVRSKGYISKDIDYTFTSVSSMPKELYGDAIKLKQVLMSVIINASKNIKKGYLHVDVNSYTKFDVCRLVIMIDSSSDTSVKRINEILNQDLEISDKDYLKIEKLDVDLPLAYKIIKSIGGTMFIKSEEHKGTRVTITIDQYIVDNSELKLNSKVEAYLRARSNVKRVLVVDDDEQETKKIKSVLEKMGYTVSVSMFGKDCIERIKNGEKYEYIVIDDELEEMSALSVIQELDKIKDKSKRVIMLEQDKLFIAKHYLKDGFYAYLDKTNLIEEIKNKCF